MNKNKIKILGFVFAIMIVSIPALTFSAGLVPDCGKVVDGVMSNPCNFESLMVLANTLINFLLFIIATPLMALILCYAGFLYISSSANPSNKTRAKSIIGKALFGYVLALAAWLIIKTIMVSLGYTGIMYLAFISNPLI